MCLGYTKSLHPKQDLDPFSRFAQRRHTDYITLWNYLAAIYFIRSFVFVEQTTTPTSLFKHMDNS